jgi:hypothetical protein
LYYLVGERILSNYFPEFLELTPPRAGLRSTAITARWNAAPCRHAQPAKPDPLDQPDQPSKPA